jgi:hypothetical protein
LFSLYWLIGWLIGECLAPPLAVFQLFGLVFNANLSSISVILWREQI